jgi:hypothetical protein
MPVLVVSILVVLFVPSLTDACPLCLTPAGQSVREGILADGFGRNLLISVLPFAVAGGFARLVSGLLARPR